VTLPPSNAAAAAVPMADSCADVPSSEEHAWRDDLANGESALHASPERIRNVSQHSRTGTSGLRGMRSRSQSPGTPLSARSPFSSRSCSRNPWNVPATSRDAGQKGENSESSSSGETKRTALVVDWDDTLFPTTWILEDAGISCHKPLDAQLTPSSRSNVIKGLMEQHSSNVEQFLKEASACALVFIITLARKDWVERSIRYFMPELVGLLDTCQIQVIYASDYLQENFKMQIASNGKPAAIDASDKPLELFIGAKADAMISALQHAGCEAANGKLGNFISIGDSDIERQGAVEASESYAQMIRGENPNSGDAILCKGKPPLLKILKLLEEPTVEELKAQLILLRRWLPFLVAEQDELDLEIASSEEDSALVELNKMITGQDEDLSWANLAGLDDHPVTLLT